MIDHLRRAPLRGHGPRRAIASPTRDKKSKRNSMRSSKRSTVRSCASDRMKGSLTDSVGGPGINHGKGRERDAPDRGLAVESAGAQTLGTVDRIVMIEGGDDGNKSGERHTREASRPTLRRLRATLQRVTLHLAGLSFRCVNVMFKPLCSLSRVPPGSALVLSVVFMCSAPNQREAMTKHSPS